MDMKRRRLWLVPAAVAVLAIAFFAWAGVYYRAGEAAREALVSGDVNVERTGYGWRFDGPSDADALIFYPGAKVEATAYAPLMRLLARRGMDACLVEMPLRLAFLGQDAAGRVMTAHDYARWYVGGHSLGGAIAANYAAAHGDRLSGVVLCAAYPTRALDEDLPVLYLYGSEDGVLNRGRLEASRKYAPGAEIRVIEGGNHAGFGDYGPQRGDGEAAISPEEQWEAVADAILEAVGAS